MDKKRVLVLGSEIALSMLREKHKAQIDKENLELVGFCDMTEEEQNLALAKQEEEEYLANPFKSMRESFEMIKCETFKEPIIEEDRGRFGQRKGRKSKKSRPYDTRPR